MTNTSIVARNPGELDAARFTMILRNAGLIDGRTKVSGVTYRGVGNGLMADSYRFHLDYDGNAADAPRTVVGKFAAADPTSKATAVKLRVYETELLFYEHLADSLDVRTPCVLFSAIDPATQDFTLLMEDQAPARAVDQLQGCSLEDCQNALLELARLHGPRWNDPALTGVAWLQQRNAITRQLVDQILTQAVEVFLERFRVRMEPEHVRILERFVSVWSTALRDEMSPRTLVHTDFRPDNLLFDVFGEQGSVVVLDWAGILHMSGLLDVGYFIGSALSEEQRREHEHDLLKAYFAELSKYPLGGYDFNACWLDYRRFPFFGLHTALLASMMVERTERADALFLQMGRKFCQMIDDLDTMSLWA